MSDKPAVFISYSHKDEPATPVDGQVAWLSFVRAYLQPAVRQGVFDLFADVSLPGGAVLAAEIERRLRACDIFLLLVSANSMASNYIVDTEIAVTRQRRARNENVCFYPLLLTPTPKVALDDLKDMIIRPRDAKPLSSFGYSERIEQMTFAADEIADIAARIAGRKSGTPRGESMRSPAGAKRTGEGALFCAWRQSAYAVSAVPMFWRTLCLGATTAA